MSEQWKYFVAYSHSRGFGNTEMSSPVPVRNWAGIQEIQRLIEEKGQDQIDSVIVLTVQLLSVPEGACANCGGAR